MAPIDPRIDQYIDHEPLIKPDSVKDFIFSKGFSVLHLNVRSLTDKFAQLQLFLSSLSVEFSCIILSETWFLQSDFTDQFKIDGYNLFCSSRTTQRGGGICVYVNQKFEARVDVVRLHGAESLVAEVARHGSRLFTVLCVYRTPSGELPGFLDSLGQVMGTLPSGTIIAGDLNIDLNPSNTSFDNKNMSRY